MTISAKVIADSISYDGQRITTFEIICPRYIWSQILTHRLFSRNCSSSRAQPIKKVIEQIKNDPVLPIHFGKNKAGMQADTEEVEEKEEALQYWKSAENMAIRYATGLSKLGVHKQIANRILEPFSHVKAVITATEWDNFFVQRCHHDAQPEIQRLAQCMEAALKINSPEKLHSGEWHTPYVSHSRDKDGKLIYGNHLTETDAIKVSVSCCAQVSYRKLDTSLEKALDLYDRLILSNPPHLSPSEHCATPMDDPTLADTVGVTHISVKDNSRWSGNFKGWVQYRQLL